MRVTDVHNLCVEPTLGAMLLAAWRDTYHTCCTERIITRNTTRDANRDGVGDHAIPAPHPVVLSDNFQQHQRKQQHRHSRLHTASVVKVAGHSRTMPMARCVTAPDKNLQHVVLPVIIICFMLYIIIINNNNNN